MKVSCAFALLALVAAVAASQQAVSDGQKSAVVSSPVQQPYQLPAAVVPYPGQNYQFASEYVSPFAKSASYAPKAAPTAVPSSFGVYQPYQQQQQYNYGPYQQYYPGASGYPAIVAAGAPYYPTAYSGQPAAYPTPYSAYPYGAQSYHHGSSSYSSYPAAAAAFQSYNGQFVAPSAAPAVAASSPYSSSQYSAVTPYSAVPSVYQQQQHSSFYSPAAAAVGQQYSPSQQYSSSQQYQLPQQYPSSSSSYYPNSVSATAAADPAVKVSSSAAEKK